jgi:hypothetical protein
LFFKIFQILEFVLNFQIDSKNKMFFILSEVNTHGDEQAWTRAGWNREGVSTWQQPTDDAIKLNAKEY